MLTPEQQTRLAAADPEHFKAHPAFHCASWIPNPGERNVMYLPLDQGANCPCHAQACVFWMLMEMQGRWKAISPPASVLDDPFGIDKATMTPEQSILCAALIESLAGEVTPDMVVAAYCEWKELRK